MNAIQWLLEMPQRFGEREFLYDTHTGESVSFAAIHIAAQRIGADLHRRGMCKGDRVLLMLHNSADFAKLYLGCLYAGLVVTPLNPVLSKKEIQQIAESADAKLFVLSSETASLVDSEPLQAMGVDVLVLNDGHSMGQIEPDAEQWSFDELPEADDFQPFEGVTDEDTMCLIFTSGTTGTPSGVEHRIGSLVGNARSFNKRLGICEENRFYGVLAMTYLGGYYNLLMLPYCAGASVVLSRTFDARAALDFWKPASEHGVNTLWLVPTIMAILMEMDRDTLGESFCREQVKLSLVGTAPLSLTLKESFEKRYGVVMQENYGLSETFFISTNSASTPGVDGCVGRILPNVQVSLADADGQTVPYGQEGEVRVCTPYLMNGYYDLDVREIKNIDRDDWFATGDLGVLTPSGDLFITGRKKNLIIRGGINISPRQIEDVLSSHPAVAECAVVGIPHPMYGEDIAAVVRLVEPSEHVQQELRELCRSQLGTVKQPSHIVELEQFPHSSSGKIQHGKIRELFKSKLGQANLDDKPSTHKKVAGPTMIPGRIRHTRPIVDGAIIKGLQKYPASLISDVLNRLSVMDAHIHTLTPGLRMAGRALTVEEVEGGNLMSHAALEMLQEGDVLVIDGKGATSRACFGGLQMLMAQQRGAAGIVINGVVRDCDDATELAIPVFAKGVSPAGPLKGWTGNVNCPVACGGVVVNPGDIVIGDDDGVTVVPSDLAETVLKCCGHRAEMEASWFEQVRDGKCTLDAVGLRDALTQFKLQIDQHGPNPSVLHQRVA